MILLLLTVVLMCIIVRTARVIVIMVVFGGLIMRQVTSNGHTARSGASEQKQGETLCLSIREFKRSDWAPRWPVSTKETRKRLST